MAELRLVKPVVESSNLSSSAKKCECGEAGVSRQSVKLLLKSTAGSNPATHTLDE